MRNQWLRLLLLRCHTQSQPPHTSQVHHLRSLTCSLLHPRAFHVTPKPLITFRHFTSSPEPAVDPPKPPPPPPSDQSVLLTDIFAKTEKTNDEIKLELDSNSVVITHDLLLSVLQRGETSPDVAKRVFNWVLQGESEKLSSKSYNWLLGILGSNGLVKESWDLIDVMKLKGYGVSKGAFNRLSKKFEEDGLSEEVEKLKKLYASGSGNIKESDLSYGNAVENLCSEISKLIRGQVWGDELEKQLKELDVEFTSDVVAIVLEKLQTDLNKALIFFRWVEESGLFKHDQGSYNAMALVLAREESTEKFWKVVNEMRARGHEMERETYVKVLDRFVRRKMMSDAVDLYEFAMIGENKPSVHDCTFLLKKIVVGKELDMDLFLKVVKVFKASGNELTNANMAGILKSLTSVGRMTECNKILGALEEGGYQPTGPLQAKIAFKLSGGRKTTQAHHYMENLVSSRHNPEDKTWASLIEGYCEARDLNEASKSLREMIEAKGASSAGYALDLVVGTYCRKNKPLNAYKLVAEMINDKSVSPWHTTYKELTSKLLVKKRFKEALHVMDMMKDQGYPPDLDSFVTYLSKAGSADEAVMFSQAMTLKRCPPKSVYLRLFEAYLKAGRISEAQDFLSKCPGFIRNNADVLNMFYSKKSGESARTPAVSL